jgi:methyl-accepting chemotaxis protein
MAQLDQVTQQNAVASQDSANASEQLSNQAEELRSIIEELNSTVSGRTAQPRERTQRVTKTPPKTQKPASAKTLEFKQPEKKAKAVTKTAAKPAFKKAAGDDSIPSENDPRFEDV